MCVSVCVCVFVCVCVCVYALLCTVIRQSKFNSFRPHTEGRIREGNDHCVHS